MRQPPEPSAETSHSAHTYRTRTPPPIVERRSPTEAEAQRLRDALRALLRGWVMTEVERRLPAASLAVPAQPENERKT